MVVISCREAEKRLPTIGRGDLEKGSRQAKRNFRRIRKNKSRPP
jgi:hypothetical protein